MDVLCTVRGCGRVLDRGQSPSRGRSDDGGKTWRCAAGHAFDVAKAGYANLLQPQDRRSKEPGDSKEVVAARRRLLDAGIGAPLLEALVPILRAEDARGAVLDAGCGEGTWLAGIAGALGLEGWGVDISLPAIEAAAKRHRAQHWIVANADRGLPFGREAFGVFLSITGRRPVEEIRRVLAPSGVAVLAVPAADDLAELRAAVQGEAHAEDRLAKVAAEFGAGFTERARRTVRHRVPLDRERLQDALAMTYRGARHRERERSAALERLDVTFAWDVLVLVRS